MFVRRSMYTGNTATPLAICHDVGNATHGAHGSNKPQVSNELEVCHERAGRPF
jgi:hypothetical protein